MQPHKKAGLSRLFCGLPRRNPERIQIDKATPPAHNQFLCSNNNLPSFPHYREPS
jgi:hypothetical protein